MVPRLLSRRGDAVDSITGLGAHCLRYLTPLVSGTVAFALLAILLRHRRLPLDQPNERSLHAIPVPRIGGLALVPALVCGWLLVPDALPVATWIALALVFAISCIDDITGLSAALRLAVHLLAAAVCAVGLMHAQAGWAAIAVAVFAIAWMTNLFNFMDGSDGLAGGMALIGFGAYAAAAAMAGGDDLALVCVAISAASAAFLGFNFHPARVFLGDAGSIPLGFLAAALGAQGWIEGLWPLWFPLVVFSAFIVDATVTLVRRAMRGARIWQAHREHYYQRLVRHGFGHRDTALAEYAVMTACAALALAAVRTPPLTQLLLIAALALGYLVAMLWVDRNCRPDGEGAC